MSGTVVMFPKREPKDEWQFTVEVYKRPDGTLAASLADCRTSLIEDCNLTVSERLHKLANDLEKSIGPMRADAEALK